MDAKCDLLVYGMGEHPSSKSPTASPPAQQSKTSATSAESLIASAARGRRFHSPPHPFTPSPLHSPFPILHSPFALPTIILPSYESISGLDLDSKKKFCTLTKISHQDTNPHNAKRLVQFHGPEPSSSTPALAAHSGRNGPRLRPSLHAPAASQLRTKKSPPTTSSNIPSKSCAAVSAAVPSVDHRPRRPHHPKPQKNPSSPKSRRMRKPSPTSPASSPISAAPPPTCTKCAAQPPRSRSRLPPPQLRPSHHLQTARHRSRPANRPDERIPPSFPA